MRIFDLSMKLYDGMPIFPGDPEVVFTPYTTLSEKGYAVTHASMGLHSGTHLDVPAHMIEGGKTISDFPLTHFCGPAQIISSLSTKITAQIILTNLEITESVVDALTATKSIKIVGSISKRYKWPIKHIKSVLAAEICFLSNLEVVEELPEFFELYCLPLKLEKLEASPVRVIGVKYG